MGTEMIKNTENTLYEKSLFTQALTERSYTDHDPPELPQNPHLSQCSLECINRPLEIEVNVRKIVAGPPRYNSDTSTPVSPILRSFKSTDLDAIEKIAIVHHFDTCYKDSKERKGRNWWQQILKRRTKPVQQDDLPEQMQKLTVTNTADSKPVSYRLTEAQIKAREERQNQAKLQHIAKNKNKTNFCDMLPSLSKGTETLSEHANRPFLYEQITPVNIPPVNKDCGYSRKKLANSQLRDKAGNEIFNQTKSILSHLAGHNDTQGVDLLSFFDQRIPVNDKANESNRKIQAKQTSEHFNIDADPDELPPESHPRYLPGTPYEIYGGSYPANSEEPKTSWLFRKAGMKSVAKNISAAEAYNNKKKAQAFLSKSQGLPKDSGIVKLGDSNLAPDSKNNRKPLLTAKPVVQANSNIADKAIPNQCARNAKHLNKYERFIINLTPVLKKRLEQQKFKNRGHANEAAMNIVAEETILLQLFKKYEMMQFLTSAIKEIPGKRYSRNDPVVIDGWSLLMNNNYAQTWGDVLLALDVSNSTREAFLNRLLANTERRLNQSRREAQRKADRAPNSISDAPQTQTVHSSNIEATSCYLNTQDSLISQDHNKSKNLTTNLHSSTSNQTSVSPLNQNSLSTSSKPNSTLASTKEIRTNNEHTENRPKRVIKKPNRYSPSVADKLYCICRKVHRERDGPMVECDGNCEDWYHFGPTNRHCDYNGVDKTWICERCRHHDNKDTDAKTDPLVKETSNNGANNEDVFVNDKQNLFHRLESISGNSVPLMDCGTLNNKTQSINCNRSSSIEINSNVSKTISDPTSVNNDLSKGSDLFNYPDPSEDFTKDSEHEESNSVHVVANSTIQNQHPLVSKKTIIAISQNLPNTDITKSQDKKPENVVKTGISYQGCSRCASLVEVFDNCNTEDVFCHRCLPVKTNQTKMNSEVGPPDHNYDETTIETICDVLQLSEDQLGYIPPKSFVITIPAEKLETIYNAKTRRLIPWEWPAAISRAMQSSQAICSFRATKSPKYYASDSEIYARCLGKCGGDCGMKFELIIKNHPILGKDLTIDGCSTGAFELRQSKPTGRPITGKERKLLAEKLEHIKARQIFLNNVTHLPGLQALHNNQQQMSPAVLRTIKSTAKANKRHCPTSESEDVAAFKRELNALHNPNTGLKGFLQTCDTSENSLCIHMYNKSSIGLMSQALKKGVTTLHFDSSGGFVNRRKPPAYLYIGVARDREGVSFILCEMLSQKHATTDVSNLLSRVSSEVKKCRQQLTKPLSDIVVVDFSFAMIHGCIQSMNTESLEDYLNRSYRFLKGEIPWPENKCCMFICTAHLEHAFIRNIGRKLKSERTKSTIELKRIAYKSLARLQETLSLEEFENAARMICNLFGKQYLSSNELLRYVSFIKDANTLSNEDGSHLMDTGIEELDSYDGSQKLLRERSEFYHLFRRIKNQQLHNSDTQDDAKSSCSSYSDNLGSSINERNPYYSPVVLEVLGDVYVPYYPLWSSSVVRKAKDSSFVRETNATVESEFKDRKHNVHRQRNIHVGDFLREEVKTIKARNKLALLKIEQLSISKESSPRKPLSKSKLDAHVAEENWKKKKTTTRTSKHYSDKHTFNLEHQQNVPLTKTYQQLDQSNLASNTNISADKFSNNSDLNDWEMDFEEEIMCGPTSDSIYEEIVTTTVESHSNSNQTHHDATLSDCGDQILFKATNCSMKVSQLQELTCPTAYLSDDLLNCYLQMVVDNNRGKPIFVTNSAWFFNDSQVLESENNFSSSEEWRGIDDMITDRKDEWIILHPLKLYNHWIGLYIDLIHHSIMILDPMRPKSNKGFYEYYSPVIMNLQPRLSKLIQETNAEWSYEQYSDFPQQTDRSSCGCYVALGLGQILENFPFQSAMLLPGNTAKKLRGAMLYLMLQTTELGRDLRETHSDFDDLMGCIRNWKTGKPESYNLLECPGKNIKNLSNERKFDDIIRDPSTLAAGMQLFHGLQDPNSKTENSFQKLLARSELQNAYDDFENLPTTMMGYLFPNYEEKKRQYENHCHTIQLLTDQQLTDLFEDVKQDIIEIFSGGKNCRRLDLYVSRNKEDLQLLKDLEVFDPFTQNQSMKIFSLIQDAICPDDPDLLVKYLRFIKQVAIPETLLRIYAYVNGVDYDLAEAEMRNGPRHSL